MVRIAVTGAGGRVGKYVLPALAEDHDVVPVNRSEVDGWETTIADITNYERLVEAFEGFDCLVHMAAQSSSDSNWSEVFEPNIQGTWNVFQAAVENDVDRLVFASSNQLSHMYNLAEVSDPRSQKAPEDSVPVSVDDPPRPAGPYGVTKVAGEAIGTYHADRYGIDVLNVRIGWVLSEEDLREKQETDLADYARTMWLSPRDCQDGIQKAVEESISENPLTVNLVSENQERYLSLTKTMRCLNYHPRDDSDIVLGE